MPQKLKLSHLARQDLTEIYEHTIKLFGLGHARRYRALIQQALRDIEEQPTRIGSQARPDLGLNFRTYHIRYSVGRSGTNVKKPRHLFVYFEVSIKTILVSRILHDAMDTPRHLPELHKKLSLD